MPIITRTKEILEYYTICWAVSESCYTYSRTITEVLRDWGTNPVNITPLKWTIGATPPPSVDLTITFPELSELEEYKTLYPGGFRFKLKKAFTGIDFVNVTGSALTGNVFNGVNLVEETVSVSFQNLDNLAVGLNSMDLLFEAYGLDTSGNETYVEDSSIQNIIIPIKLTVLSGSGFNTNKNTYNVVFNKADNSLSGDANIIVYSTSAVSANSPNNYIQLSQSSTASERILAFQNNANLQSLAVGNYTSSVIITRDTTSKTVAVNLQVINDTTQFYVAPTHFNLSLQKNLSESKTVTVNISNPNNLTITVDLKPSFIASAVITGNTLTITTENSSSLALGNYSGDVILKSGSVTKVISINLSVLQAIINDFTNANYFFALDKNKVILNKTNTSSTYVKMVLEMFFQGFGKTYQENQTYTFPFFQGSVEIYPGEEIQDFFIKAIDFIRVSNPQNQYNLANVNLKFYEMTDADVIVSSFTLDRVKFAPGKKPKCFPIFTDHSVRSTYPLSLINISVDKLSDKTEIVDLYTQYQLAKPAFSNSLGIDNFQFERKKFLQNLENSIISNSKLQFIPLPSVDEVVHIEWENQNLVFDWFTAVKKTKETTEIEHITAESKLYKEEKFDSSYSKPFTVNTGWIMEEEIDLISDLLMSRICIIHYSGKTVKAFPIGKKNELKDSENNKFSMDLEFKILIEK